MVRDLHLCPFLSRCHQVITMLNSM
uniref:Uncharacterized protein n=1 Tax=Arundo donax TaxID=35708 RepID=A0A0A8XVV7_ARUDO